MKFIFKLTILVLAFVFVVPVYKGHTVDTLFADHAGIEVATGEYNMWHCRAHDISGHWWYWNAEVKAAAIERAREACRISSEFPQSCRVKASDCTYY